MENSFSSQSSSCSFRWLWSNAELLQVSLAQRAIRGAHFASLAWKFWKRYSGINSLLNIDSGVETPLSRGLSSPVIPHLVWELVNKNIAMGLAAKQFFQNQLQAQMLSELFPLEQWEFWWAWRSGLTASPRQPAHRKASESFSLMREPQMSNRKKFKLEFPTVYFHLCVPTWDFLASKGTLLWVRGFVCTLLWVRGLIADHFRQFRHFSKIFVWMEVCWSWGWLRWDHVPCPVNPAMCSSGLAFLP